MDCAEIRDDRLDALYGEASDQALRRVAAHHVECRTCREEFDALRGVRRQLSSWRLPARLLAWPAPRRRPFVGLAAAAGLLLALAGAARLSGVAFEYHAGGLQVRLGASDVREQLREQETRHLAEIRALRSSLEEYQARPAAAAADQGAILQRVEELLHESDVRQQQRLSASLESLAARSEARRRYDLARVSAGLSYLEGKNGQHVARTSELMGYMLQASQQK